MYLDLVSSRHIILATFGSNILECLIKQNYKTNQHFSYHIKNIYLSNLARIQWIRDYFKGSGQIKELFNIHFRPERRSPSPDISHANADSLHKEF